MELFILFCGLQLADIYTTHKVLAKGGMEMNPIMAMLFKRFGHMPALVVVKSAVCGLLYWAQIPEILMFGLCVLYVAVVFNNAKQMAGSSVSE